MSSESSPRLAHEPPGGHAPGRPPPPETEPIPRPDPPGGEGRDASTHELSELPGLIRAALQARTVHGTRADADRETETAGGHTPHLLLRPRTRLEEGLLCILEPIDAGGMGQVYLAWHEALNTEVVVKVARVPAMEARFRHEIELQNRLGSHPHIVAVKTAGRFGDGSYLMMEYVPGQDLKRYISEHGPLPWREACAYIRQAALGLAHAHAQGVVHRDVKPSNLIRREDGLIKILDWGLARRLDRASPDEDQRLTQPGCIPGTPDYIAPERIGDPERVGPASDLYSLGCTLYELLTGRPPFHRHDNKPQAHLGAPIPALPAELGVPPDVDRVLRRLLAKRVERRYGSAQEFVEALDAALAATARPRLVRDAVPAALRAIGLRRLEKAPAARPPSAAALADDLHGFLAGKPIDPRPRGPEPPGPRPGRHPRAIAVAAAVLLIAGPALVYALGRWGPGPRPRQEDQPLSRVIPDVKGIPPSPLSDLGGSIDLVVYESASAGPDEFKRGDPARQGLRLHERRALPLRPSDWVRIEAALNRPAYLYVVWIDTDGKVSPLWPWEDGDWTRLPPEQSPSDRLTLPEPEGGHDVMPLAGGPPGVEALLMLAREMPLSPGENSEVIRILSRPLPRQPMAPSEAAVHFALWLENGERVTDEPTRAPILSKAQSSGDPEVQVRNLMKQFRATFPYTRAVCFGNRGKR